MAVDLTPSQPNKAYGGEGGAYYEWCPASLPMLGLASIGASKLSLAAGLSLPNYSDSAKVAYALQGILPPEAEATKEKATELVVLFLGDTSKVQLTGANGVFTGFFTEFVGRAWDLSQQDAAKLVSSQPATGIVKKAGQKLPEPSPKDREGMALRRRSTRTSRTAAASSCSTPRTCRWFVMRTCVYCHSHSPFSHLKILAVLISVFNVVE